MNTEKVTLIGFQASGKTCYLAGMYDIMSFGLKNFVLLATDNSNDYYLQSLWEGLRDADKRTWPAGNDQVHEFVFNLSHNFDTICEFEWLDYPGGALVDPKAAEILGKLMEQLKESSCLIIMVDGRSFAVSTQNDEEYKKVVSRNLHRNKDLVAVKRLAEIGRTQVIPPIAIVISKSDLIDDHHVSLIPEIIKENFAAVFGENGEDKRLVMITAVTLGDGIMDGMDADPENIEQPIAYAVLCILCRYIDMARKAKAANMNLVEENSKFWKGILGGFLTREKLEEARRNIVELDKIINKFSKDSFKLLELFEHVNKPLYVNGKSVPLKDYFEKILRM